jgi:hypothetical protein
MTPIPTGRGQIKSAMTIKIEQATAVLVGKTVWRCTRAADMACFQFGAQGKVLTYKGETKEAGEYALHVECPWRFTRQDQVIVGKGDLYYPAEHIEEAEIPPSFNWDKDLNRQDRLLALLFENGKREFLVEEIRVKAAGSLSILLSDGLALDVFPADSLGDEHWRLFEPGKDKRHFVVTGNGIKT